MDAPLRLSLTISGGASLGAYEAGAAAALTLAVQRLAQSEDVDASIDAVGGASAGALVALSTAHCLVEGIDPVPVMHEAWVERVSLRELRARDGHAPLDLDRLRDDLPRMLDPRDDQDRPAHRLGARQERPVALHVALTNLPGLTYPIHGLRDEPVRAMTFVDWAEFELEPGGGIDQLLRPEGRTAIDVVLASAAHPGAFAPRVLDRSGDVEGYRGHGVDSLPESGHLWYTDGGLLQAEPIGRVIASATTHTSEGENRVHLLVDPRSEDPSGAGRWTDPDIDPYWHEGLKRSLEILPAQALYDDLRRVESLNEQIEWVDALADELAPALGSDARDALGRALERAGDEPPADGEDVGDTLRRALRAVAGLSGKRPAKVDVISPLLLRDQDGEHVGDLLAGDLLGDFGGFLSRDLRASDFALGYESAVAWLPEGLARCGVDDGPVERVVAAAEDARIDRLEDVHRGRAGIGDLPLREQAELGKLAAQWVRVLSHAATGGRAAVAERARGLVARVRGDGR